MFYQVKHVRCVQFLTLELTDFQTSLTSSEHQEHLKPKRYLLRQVLQLSPKPSRFWSQERAVNYYHGREKDEKDWREKEREKMTERKKKIRERLMREDFLVILWERARREFRRPVSWVHAVPLSLLSRSPPRVPPSQDAVLVVQRIPRMQQV